MKEIKEKPIITNHLWIIYIVALLAIGFLVYFNWLVGLLIGILVTLSFLYMYISERSYQLEQLEYISNLSHRVTGVGNDALLKMPIGIILYNDNYEIEWINPYMRGFTNKENVFGKSLEVISEELIEKIEEESEEAIDEEIDNDKSPKKEIKKQFNIKIDKYEYEVNLDKNRQLLYFIDKTEELKLKRENYNEKTVIALIYLDNYEEISRNMTDSVKSQLNSKVTEALNKWANNYGFYIKRTSQDRFMGILTREVLESVENSKFEVLDEVRELVIDEGQRNPITLSMGIGTGNVAVPELAQLAQSGLDLALGRGGDQITIRDESGKISFYGGKTNPMEKRTRVRARVISHALKNLVEDSDNVVIMGHKAPDMDSLGATIGVLNIARSNNKEGYIVFDEDDVMTGVSRVVEEIKQDGEIWKHFVSPEDAEAVITEKSLLVVVDTHKPSMVAHSPLLNATDHIVVIDHHRRGEDFIDQPVLVYMEPYASSTAELVTELIEYQPKKKKLNALEATSLLAGIIVDTKSFALRTGSRTFDAASYLRAKGADLVLIQKFLKENLSTYVKKGKLIEKSYLYKDSLAIAKAEKGDVFNQVLIAQTADTLLTMNEVKASFVISERDDKMISISARSLGEVNVQIIMEALNGGGHLTNAATQIKDKTIDEAETLLIEAIDEYLEGRQ